MIHDSLKHAERYATVHPLFAQAFDFLQHTDLKELKPGKIELIPDSLIVNVVELTGKRKEDAKMETHQRFIDIEVPIGATETMGWKSSSDLTQPLDGYDLEKDIAFFADDATSFLQVNPFEFAIFFPEDGHQPGIGSGTYTKIIVKVRV